MTDKHYDKTETEKIVNALLDWLESRDERDNWLETWDERDDIVDPEGTDPETLLEAFPEERSEEVIFEEIDQEEILARLTEEESDEE